MKTQQEVIDIVKNNNPIHYIKSGEYSYEISDKTQRVVTMIGQEKETENTANEGDYILTGVSGEKYVVQPESFKKRYEDLGNGRAKAKGECWGNVYRGEPIEFTAPWGEHSICKTGDYLVSPNPEFTEAYRVAANEFVKTYKPVS